MERIRIITAIVLILSALRKFEDMVAEYSENVEAGRFNIEDCTCILGITRRQTPLSFSEQGSDSALRSRFKSVGAVTEKDAFRY